jgi:hypothetical protein
LRTPEKEGVIVYAKTAQDNHLLTWVDTAGKIITQSQYRILKAAACFASNSKWFIQLCIAMGKS